MSAPDQLVHRYLRRLHRALSGLPPAQRAEITDSVAEHIGALRDELTDGGTEAQVRSILDRLGDPGTIAARAREEAGLAPPPPERWGVRDTTGVLLLTLGALLLPFVGPLVGLLLVAGSPHWSSRRKLTAFAVPAGLLVAVSLAVFLAQGYWRMEMLFVAPVLVPAGAGIALAVPSAPHPPARRARAVGRGVLAALVVLLAFADLALTDFYGVVLLVVLGAIVTGRFGIGDQRRPAAVA